MRSLTKFFWIDVAIIASIALPIACASEGEEAGPSTTPDASTDSNVVPDARLPSDAGVDASPCSSSNLCSVPLSTDENLELMSIRGSSRNDVWSVGSGGTVLHYDGAKWEVASPASPDPNSSAVFTLRSVWLESPDDVWIADGHRLRHTTGWKGPNATEWSFLSFPSGQCTPVSIAGHGSTVWVARGVVNAGCPWQLGRFEGWSADAGAAAVPGVSGNTASISVVMSRPDEAWASFNWRPAFLNVAHRIFRLSSASDGGAPAWESVEFDSVSRRRMLAVWGDEDVIWLGGEGGALRRLARAAVSTKEFEIVPSPVITELNGMFGFGADDVWAVGEASTVIHWDGTSWKQLSTPFDDAGKRPDLTAVWGSSPDDVWIVGDGTMLHYQGKAQ